MEFIVSCTTIIGVSGATEVRGIIFGNRVGAAFRGGTMLDVVWGQFKEVVGRQGLCNARHRCGFLLHIAEGSCVTGSNMFISTVLLLFCALIFNYAAGRTSFRQTVFSSKGSPEVLRATRIQGQRTALLVPLDPFDGFGTVIPVEKYPGCSELVCC